MSQSAQSINQNPSTSPPASFIAGLGMITSIGFSSAMTAASVKAGISGYQASNDFFNSDGEQITLATIPDDLFSSYIVEEEDDDLYSIQYDRILKMAFLAIEEAIDGVVFNSPVPLILAVPEETDSDNYVPLEMFVGKLLKQEGYPFQAESIRFVSTGRAGALQAIKIAEEYLHEKGMDFVLIGSSDSYLEPARLMQIDEKERLLAQDRMDGFAGGEGAGFVLLTRQASLAKQKNNNIISITGFGSALEKGHMYSSEPYQGEGLDNAFKAALINYNGEGIDTVYSSMNGESHWGKEYGVAMIRNKDCFKESVSIQHPADCFGDLGTATGSVLLGLSALQLLQEANCKESLVYASSDTAWRAVVTMKKIQLA